MTTIEGGFHMKDGKMDDETQKKFEEKVNIFDSNEEKENDNDNKLENIGSPADMDEFEEETGKNAIWHGEVTNQYKKWLEENK